MFKSFVVAGLAAFTIVAAALPAAAEHRPRDRGHDRGGVRFELQFGDDYGDRDCYRTRYGVRCFEDDPYFLNDYGTPGAHLHLRYPRLRHIEYKMTCEQAVRKLRNNGFRRVNAFDCRGTNYGFTAKKHGKRYEIVFNARTGQYSVDRV